MVAWLDLSNVSSNSYPCKKHSVAKFLMYLSVDKANHLFEHYERSTKMVPFVSILCRAPVKASSRIKPLMITLGICQTATLDNEACCFPAINVLSHSATAQRGNWLRCSANILRWLLWELSWWFTLNLLYAWRMNLLYANSDVKNHQIAASKFTHANTITYPRLVRARLEPRNHFLRSRETPSTVSACLSIPTNVNHLPSRT